MSLSSLISPLSSHFVSLHLCLSSPLSLSSPFTPITPSEEPKCLVTKILITRTPRHGVLLAKINSETTKLSNVTILSGMVTVITANGEVQTNEAQVHIHDLDLFVTVQLLDDTPGVLSWANSAKSTVIPMSGPVVKSHI